MCLVYRDIPIWGQLSMHSTISGWEGVIDDVTSHMPHALRTGRALKRPP